MSFLLQKKKKKENTKLSGDIPAVFLVRPLAVWSTEGLLGAFTCFGPAGHTLITYGLLCSDIISEDVFFGRCLGEKK